LNKEHRSTQQRKPRNNVKKLLITGLASLALAFALSNSARATVVCLTPPQETESWNSGQFHDPEPFSYNLVVGIYQSGSQFESPGFSSLSAGWTSTYYSATRIEAAGTLTTDLYYQFNFLGPLNGSTTSVWDFWVYNGTTAEAGYRMSYGTPGAVACGNGWYYTILDNGDAPAVPEPGTILAGALLLLPFGLSTIRVLRKGRK
jgi:hypothetical protein